MKVLLDQNIPREIGEWLMEVHPRWEVVHASDAGLAGASDTRVFETAQELGALVVTHDEHFTDRRLFSLPHAGVVRLNVWPTTVETTQEALLKLLREIPDDELRGAIVIVDRQRLRVRRR